MKRYLFLSRLAHSLTMLCLCGIVSLASAQVPSGSRIQPGGVRAPLVGAAAPERAEGTVPGVASAIEGAREGVRLLGAGAAGVRFEVEVPAAVLSPLNGPDGFTALAIDGYQTLALPGEPALPRRVVFVAVPPTGDVRVRSSGLDPAPHNGVRLAPQPHANEDDRETPIFGALPTARSLSRT
jgi:hypothetical protein